MDPLMKGIEKIHFNTCRIGLVESKIRKLVENLERNPFIKLAHVHLSSYGALEERYCLGMYFAVCLFDKVQP